jgi:hypothetical protein
MIIPQRTVAAPELGGVGRQLATELTHMSSFGGFAPRSKRLTQGGFPLHTPRVGAVMNAYTVTSKGQIMLRKDPLSHVGVQAGEKIDIEKVPGGGIKITALKATGI